MKTITIEKLSDEGRGIGYIDGKTAFVDGALPGETAAIRVLKKKRHYIDAQAQTIINPSAERVPPACPHFATCGGCRLQYLPPDQQLALKEATFFEQLQKFGQTQPETVIAPLKGPYWGYRRKARLGIKYVPKKGKVLIGFREQGKPGFINDTRLCLVLVPELGLKLDWLASQLATLDACDRIPQVEVAQGDHKLALVFRHLSTLSAKDYARFRAIGQTAGWQIYLQPGGPESVERIEPASDDEPLYYRLPDHEIALRFAPLDFIQVNGHVNRLLVNRALALLAPEPHEHLLDLFCGLGNFSLPMARLAASVTGIEGDAAMVAKAGENARLNGLTNTQFIGADLTQLNEQLPKRIDKVLLDPPRTGAQTIIDQLIPRKPRRWVYISCNPATLARDSAILTQNGYTMTQAGVIDMFPHTRHVECIACFELKG